MAFKPTVFTDVKITGALEVDGATLEGGQATVADPAAVTGLANNADVATLVALKTELEATNTTVAAIIDRLEAAGIILEA